MSVFCCANDEQFRLEDLRRVFDGKKDMSYREYIEEYYDRQGK